MGWGISSAPCPDQEEGSKITRVERGRLPSSSANLAEVSDVCGGKPQQSPSTWLKGNRLWAFDQETLALVQAMDGMFQGHVGTVGPVSDGFGSHLKCFLLGSATSHCIRRC